MRSNVKKCLVIGGGGFLGRHLCRCLIASGMDVTVAARSIPDLWDGPPVSLSDISTLDTEFDVVYLLAAHIPYGAMDRSSNELLQANIVLPLMVAEKFSTIRLVYISSISVYGTPLMIPVDEDHPFNRPSAYGLSKLSGECAVSAHPDHIILRLSSLYGTGMRKSSFLPVIIDDALRFRQITLFGDGGRKQDYLHVKDAARMIRAAGDSSVSGVFNLVNGDPASNLEAARTVAAVLGDVTIVHKGEDHTPDTIFSAQKWKSVFPVLPEVALCSGIREMLAYEK